MLVPFHLSIGTRVVTRLIVFNTFGFHLTVLDFEMFWFAAPVPLCTMCGSYRVKYF